MIELKNGKIFIDHDDVLKLGGRFKSYFKFAKMIVLIWDISAYYPKFIKVNELFLCYFKF